MIEMNEREKFLLDLQGFLQVEGFLTAEEVRTLNEAVDANVDEEAEGFFPEGAQYGGGMDGQSGKGHAAGMLTWKQPWCQRYSSTRIYGRADHYWESIMCYTSLGCKERFAKFIGTLTARQRELFRFPPAAHSYCNSKTLALLEEQYPGWNARGEYA